MAGRHWSALALHGPPVARMHLPLQAHLNFNCRANGYASLGGMLAQAHTAGESEAL